MIQCKLDLITVVTLATWVCMLHSQWNSCIRIYYIYIKQCTVDWENFVIRKLREDHCSKHMKYISIKILIHKIIIIRTLESKYRISSSSNRSTRYGTTSCYKQRTNS